MLKRSDSVQIHLRIGDTSKPVPSSAMQALTSVTVTLGAGGAGPQAVDGFELDFELDRNGSEFGLLRDSTFAPMTRVKVGIGLGSRLEVLIDGTVTTNELKSSPDPTKQIYQVKGEDIGMHLSLEERDASHPQQCYSDIVKKIVTSSPYAKHGLEPKVTATHYTPSDQEHTPHQHETDAAYVSRLAQHHGFVFYCEPVDFKKTIFFWGPPPRPGELLPALRINTIGFDSVISLSFDSGALSGANVSGRSLDPVKRQDSASPSDPGSQPRPFAASPLAPVRTRIERTTANLPTARAAATIGGTPRNAPPPATGQGKLDTVRYGAILRPHRSVGVAGAGTSFDGSWDVKSVTHTLTRGSSMQEFTLTREGTGTTVQRVTP